MKVFLTESINQDAETLLREHVELDIGTLEMGKKKFLERISDSDILFSKTDPLLIDRKVMDAAPKLKYIARHGSGYNNVDMVYAGEKGIMVSNTPNVNAMAIAEYTMGLMLMMTRRLMDAALASRNGNPQRLDFMGTDLQGKTLGIIGVGSIGRELVYRALAFRMKVLAYHPRPSAKKLADLDITLVDLPELLANSDIVTIHAPLTEQTRNLISSPELSIMKKSSYLINIGRGGMVDESALALALRQGDITGAALDVVEEEPVQKGHPLLELDNALIMPHMAALTHETQKNIAMTAVEDIILFCQGKTPKYLVNLKV